MDNVNSFGNDNGGFLGKRRRFEKYDNNKIQRL